MEKISKITQPLFLILLVIGFMMLMKDFLIPLAYGFIIALIVYPICKKLETKKVPRSIAIFISILLVVVVLSCIILIFILQLNVLNKEIPDLSIKLNQLLADAQIWLDANFGWSEKQQEEMMNTTEEKFYANIGNLLTGSFTIAAETLINLVIIPLYAILILYYRGGLIAFVSAILGKRYNESLPQILSETIHVYFNYIKGMLWVYVTVGILNSIGLLALGVDYAILLGMVTAFMTIIPYVGIIISSILPIALIWIETDNIWYPIGVVGVFAVVQYLEANIIFPYIVGKQLGVNALISIASIFIGWVIWGVTGMIIFLPFVALLRIVSGHFVQLKPIHQLLGPLNKTH